MIPALLTSRLLAPRAVLSRCFVAELISCDHLLLLLQKLLHVYGLGVYYVVLTDESSTVALVFVSRSTLCLNIPFRLLLLCCHFSSS